MQVFVYKFFTYIRVYIYIYIYIFVRVKMLDKDKYIRKYVTDNSYFSNVEI